MKGLRAVEIVLDVHWQLKVETLDSLPIGILKPQKNGVVAYLRSEPVVTVATSRTR